MSNTLDVLNAAWMAFYNNKPTATIVQNTSQSVPNNTDTVLTFDTVVTDNWGGWSNGNPTRYTAQVPGLYLLFGSGSWGGNAAGRRITYYRLNGSTAITGSAGDLASSQSNTMIVQSTPVIQFLNANDYVELVVNQSSGGALSTQGGTNAFTCTMTLIFMHL